MKFINLCLSLVAAGMSATATAQVGPIMILPTYQKPPAKCYDPKLPQKPALVEDRQRRADAAIRDYLAIAASSTDLTAAFFHKKYGRWLIDGAQQPLKGARDPWAARVANIERIGFAVSNLSIYDYHAAWRATAADGSTLGYYDASLKRVDKGHGAIFVLNLTSPTAEPPKVTRYCTIPNDIEDPRLR